MKSILLTLLCVGNLCGANAGFEHFGAPGISGGYFNDWSPFGITDKGFDFSIGFTLGGGEEASSKHFWKSKKTNLLLEIDSIAAINFILSDISGEPTSNRKLDPIIVVRSLLAVHFAREGRTGLPLYFQDHSEILATMSRLKKAGMDESTQTLLTRLANESELRVDPASMEFKVIWYEIDKFGGIERVTVQGRSEPAKVTSILHEVVYEAGKVRPDLLQGKNISNPLME